MSSQAQLHHSAPVLHELHGAQARQPRFIAIASGKGGVGKTWFSISLAQCLAQWEKPLRVLVVDGDFGLANVDIQLGLTPSRDLMDVIRNRASLSDVIYSFYPARLSKRHANCSFDILPGHSGIPAMAALGQGILDDILRELRLMTQYDVIIVDLCAGIDPLTRRIAAMADTLLTIATEEPTALTDAYAVIKLHLRDRMALSCVNSDSRIVINQATSVRSGERIYGNLARACQSFLGQTPKLAGVIRKDGRVPDTIRKQIPIMTRHPNAPSVTDICHIAEQLL